MNATFAHGAVRGALALSVAIIFWLPQPAFAQTHRGHENPDRQKPTQPTRDDRPMQTDPSAVRHDHEGEADQGQADQGQAHEEHAGHDENAANMPREPIPPVTDADRAAAFPPLTTHHAHGERMVAMLIVDRLEAWDAEDERGERWELQGWLGGDVQRVWLRSEGERAGGVTEHAEVELLYGRSVSAWWDLMAGLRHDTRPGPSQTRVAIGVQGLAPYKFEIAATGYLGDGGRSSARVEAEYELLLTNRLILQPALELEFNDRRDLRRGTGAGLSKAEAGLRLRYEFTRRFAPYLGVEHERSLGGTAALKRDAGEPSRETRLIVGLRLWF
jgi:copper resistance protein B